MKVSCGSRPLGVTTLVENFPRQKYQEYKRVKKKPVRNVGWCWVKKPETISFS